MANCCDPNASKIFQMQVGDGSVGIIGLIIIFSFKFF